MSERQCWLGKRDYRRGEVLRFEKYLRYNQQDFRRKKEQLYKEETQNTV